MLRSIKIERFKSIRSQTIDLGRVNIFIGANGCGKSNVLEAIGVLAASLGRGHSGTDLSRMGVRLSPAEMMKSAHKEMELPKTLLLSGSFDGELEYTCNLMSSNRDPRLRFHSERCMLGQNKLFSRGPRGAKIFGQSSVSTDFDKHRGMWDQIKIAYRFDETVRNTFRAFSEYRIYSPQTDFLRGAKVATISDVPPGLHGEGLPEAVLRLIQQTRSGGRPESVARREQELTRKALNLAYLPGWTRGVRIGPVKPELISPEIPNPSDRLLYFIDIFMREDRNRVTAYDSSEGTLFLLFAAAVSALRDAPKYFSLDNVDSALNPRMTESLVRKLIEFTLVSTAEDLSVGPRQIFLTSHNPTSLDAFDLFDDNQRIFVVKRDAQGHSQVTRLRPRAGITREQWSVVHKGRKLSQLWLDEAISGINGPRRGYEL